MAFSNPKPYVHPLIFMTFFLLLLDIVKSNDSIRFTFPDFSSAADSGEITFHGHAISTRGTLKLTKTDSNMSAGQALFSECVRLWDAKGRVASFYTSFTFLLEVTDENPADGFTFFLAPQDFNVPSDYVDRSWGGNLGLFEFDTNTDTCKNQVVAVEFDTWFNEEYNDPKYRHIGIDVNSIISVATRRWNDDDIFSGSIATAHISYDGNSKVLTSVVTYPNGGDYTLSYVVDLTKVLPEWIKVGFSAGTGFFQAHYILSWHFSSTLEEISVCAKKQNLRSVV